MYLIGEDFYLSDNFQYLKPGVVVSIKDEQGLGRIKVAIKGPSSVGGDDGWYNNLKSKEENLENLAWSFPLLPKHLSAIPKEGETVWVFVTSTKKQHSDRLYIGPIISNVTKLNEDNLVNGTPYTPFTFGTIEGGRPAIYDEKTNNNRLEDLKGIFPKADEISIQGRYNTDITQKNNEVVIRAGKFESTGTNEFKIKFNFSTQGFIQIKNNVKLPFPNEQNKDLTENGSITNIVSNKINLFTYKDGSPRLNINNDTLISDEELSRMFEESHQLPFGDKVLEYLKLLRDAVVNHVHRTSGLSATDSINSQSVKLLIDKSKQLETEILSKNIRIN